MWIIKFFRRGFKSPYCGGFVFPSPWFIHLVWWWKQILFFNSVSVSREFFSGPFKPPFEEWELIFRKAARHWDLNCHHQIYYCHRHECRELEEKEEVTCCCKWPRREKEGRALIVIYGNMFIALSTWAGYVSAGWTVIYLFRVPSPGWPVWAAGR